MSNDAVGQAGVRHGDGRASRGTAGARWSECVVGRPPRRAPPALARYKHTDTSSRFLTVDLAQQPLPGPSEHAAHHLSARAVDLSRPDARFHNDDTGAPAYPSAVLLPVVLCAYAHGIVGGRGFERLCREHVTFTAPCGGYRPALAPIFGNLRANKRLHRFTVRGRTKGDARRRRRCLVHDVEKLAHAGCAA